ncbi:hypothetical protein [Cryobacterium suzukii]|uniref:hypothetical protein n=1 Tax=Cryobacterium suzukii TaxID=1259198 RepID=UPI0030BA23F7
MWTRVRLDLRPYLGDDQAAEVPRSRTLGAADADIGQGDVSCAVLTPRATRSVSSRRGNHVLGAVPQVERMIADKDIRRMRRQSGASWSA